MLFKRDIDLGNSISGVKLTFAISDEVGDIDKAILIASGGIRGRAAGIDINQIKKLHQACTEVLDFMAKKGQFAETAKTTKAEPTFTDKLPIIPATAHDDNHQVEVPFDCVDWFQQASTDEIIELADCGWGGDRPADVVVEYYRGKHPVVDDMFTCTRPPGHTFDAIGFECYINPKEAMAWLKVNRPDAHQNILDAVGDQE